METFKTRASILQMKVVCYVLLRTIKWYIFPGESLVI